MDEFLMNRSSPGLSQRDASLSISKSIDGFLKFKTAEGLSRRTITSYEYTLNRWLTSFGDRSVSEVQVSDITGYLAWLRTEYKPVRFNGSSEPLSPKSIRNVWGMFRSFFGWLHVEFQYANPAAEIKGPKFQKHPVEPLTKEDIEKILKACVYTRESQTEERKKKGSLGISVVAPIFGGDFAENRRFYRYMRPVSRRFPKSQKKSRMSIITLFGARYFP